MGLALCLIAVEDARAEVTAEAAGELPAEILGVADAAVHALSREWRREMCRVAREKNPAGAPALGDARMEVIHGLAHDLELCVFFAALSEERAHACFGQQLFRLLAGQHHELVATRAFRPRQRQRGTRRIAIDPGVAEALA